MNDAEDIWSEEDTMIGTELGIVPGSFLLASVRCYV